MKKFLIFILLVVVGYFVYTNFIKEEKVVQIKASYSSQVEAGSANAPSINQRVYGHYEGTIKNIGQDTLTNLVITYIIDAQESESRLDMLTPGQEVRFTTNRVGLRHMDPDHHLQGITYNKR